ncbi:MAG: glucose 1-dehydrogenase [Glaciecola sp.]|jgi:NAD(P)-dependent dehydrogenase (short-subunit alcohol dehydrogenase family)
MSNTVVITGGASGIGAAAAEHFAKRGYRVVISDINSDDGHALAQRLNAEYGAETMAFFNCDVSDKEAVQAFFTQAQAHLGHISVAVNNAGVEYPPSPLHLTDDALFEQNIDINLKGVWYCMKAVLPYMLQQGQGSIINLASVAGLRSAPMIAGYSATKHAVVGLTKSAAVEYARAGIRINAVCPSFIDTPMVQRVLNEMDDKGKRSIIGASPMHRLGQVDEVAAAIVWLASSEASYMNGHCMTLDGGMLA